MPIAVAVVDPDGVLTAFVRMDVASLIAIRIAQQKAWSAVCFNLTNHGLTNHGLTTLGLSDFIKNAPSLLASFPHQEDMVLFGGDYLNTPGSNLIGGIGVSGGHYSQDQRCAEDGPAAIGAS